MKKRDVWRAGLGSGIFPNTFSFLYRKDGKWVQCSYCGRFVHYKQITRDHVYPKSKGGIIKTPACEKCNIDKENMLPIEWAIYAAKHNLNFVTLPFEADYFRPDPELLDEGFYYQQLSNLFCALISQKEDEQLASVA